MFIFIIKKKSKWESTCEKIEIQVITSQNESEWRKLSESDAVHV
jgi:hypothetical protein